MYSIIQPSDIEFFTKAFSTFFVIIGPLDIVVIFAILTSKKTALQQRSIALKGCGIAFSILLFFTFFGSWLVSSIGIGIPALKASGGFLLMIVAYNMIFDSSSSHSIDYGEEEEKEAKTADDISVFPLATPLIAGAGAMSATILFSSEATGSITRTILVILSFGCVILLTYIAFLMASKLQKILGTTLLNIITRVMGILLAALSLQFVLDGLKLAGVF